MTSSSHELLTLAKAEYKRNEDEIALHWRRNGKPASFRWAFMPPPGPPEKVSDDAALILPLNVFYHITPRESVLTGDRYIEVGMSADGKEVFYFQMIPH